MRKDGRLLKRDFERFLAKQAADREFYRPMEAVTTCPIATWVREKVGLKEACIGTTYYYPDGHSSQVVELPKWARKFIDTADNHKEESARFFLRLLRRVK